MYRITSLIICLVVLYSCGSAKIEGTPQQIALQKELAEQTAFKITSNWANPMPTAALNAVANSGLMPAGSSASRMNILQTPNYLEMNGNKARIDLPYYGERQMGGGYNNTSDNGITYKGEVNNLKVEFIDKRKVYRIAFNVKNNTESLDFTIELYQNMNTRIQVTSSHRTSISYDGAAEKLPEETAVE